MVQHYASWLLLEGIKPGRETPIATRSPAPNAGRRGCTRLPRLEVKHLPPRCGSFIRDPHDIHGVKWWDLAPLRRFNTQFLYS